MSSSNGKRSEALSKIEKHFKKQCAFCMANDKKLCACNGCRLAYYCSKECQRAAWKSAHKYTCEALSPKYTTAVDDMDGINEVLADILDYLDRSIHNRDKGYRKDICREFWSQPERLLFSSECADGIDPISLCMAQEVQILLQNACADACWELTSMFDNCSKVAEKAMMAHGRQQAICFEEDSHTKEYINQITWLWHSVLFWTLSLQWLEYTDNLDWEGERAARLRINRAMSLQSMMMLIRDAHTGFAGNDCREVLGFWWPWKDAARPTPETACGPERQRGRWDLCLALSMAAIGDTKKAMRCMGASCETRAVAHILYGRAAINHDPISAFQEAIAVLDQGNCRSVPGTQQERDGRNRAIRWHIHNLSKDSEDPDRQVAEFRFHRMSEPFHVANSDAVQMGGGPYEHEMGEPLRFPCQRGNGCKFCESFPSAYLPG